MNTTPCVDEERGRGCVASAYLVTSQVWVNGIPPLFYIVVEGYLRCLFFSDIRTELSCRIIVKYYAVRRHLKPTSKDVRHEQICLMRDNPMATGHP